MMVQIALGVILGSVSLAILKGVFKAVFVLQQKLPYHFAFHRDGSLCLWKKAETKCNRDEFLRTIIDTKYL